ncbi:MAG: DUF3828 domain-containing protein [Hyphomonadaceae bacterium]
MRTIQAALAASLLALAAGCEAPDPNGPAATVEKAYAGYLQAPWTGDFMRAAPYTAAFTAAVDRAGEYGRLLDEPVLDYDPIANAQDGDITKLKVERVRASASAALVRARFDNSGRPMEVLYDMKREGDGWRIDNIRSKESNLRGSIEDNIKPAGDPAAMRAPVQAVYDAYGAQSDPAKPVEPLHRWAALTTAFRSIMEMRAAQAKRADHDALGFDLVMDGAEWRISDLALEPASSAVIARFKNAGAPHVIVYDLAQEDGAWKIDNIRSPGKWDARTKLAEGGAESALP